jgi:hypothetical protein
MSASLEVSTVTYTLTLSLVGSVPALVTSSPAGITCALPGPGDRTQTYLAGTTVTQTATTPFTFNGWTGGGCSGIGACVVNMNDDKSVAANFS